jgi:hypothetical protein
LRREKKKLKMKLENKLLFFSLLCMIVLVSGCISQKKISEERALQIARSTEEVKTFLSFYGACEGCNPSYSQGHDNLIGCVEYSIEKSLIANAYMVSYEVSDACSFRYGTSISSLRQPQVKIAIDKESGQILTKYPDIEYINEPNYCRTDEDCLCKSGSGVEIIGCGNFLHGATNLAGSYTCEKCKCVNSSCKM